MSCLNYPLPISASYRKAIFEAIVLQVIVGVFSLMILDGGTIARVCGIAMSAFWAGAATLIFRTAQAPSVIDLTFVRFGYLPVLLLALFLVHFIWHLRGVL